MAEGLRDVLVREREKERDADSFPCPEFVIPNVF